MTSTRITLPCRRCGTPVEVGEKAVACECWRCLYSGASHLPKPQKPERPPIFNRRVRRAQKMATG